MEDTMVISLIVAATFYYISLKKFKSKNFSWIFSGLIFFIVIVVFGAFPNWAYKNEGSGTDEKELSFFESFYNGELINQKIEKKDICIFQEIDGNKKILDSNYSIIENDQAGAYVIKHYSKKLVRRSWTPWVLSLIYFVNFKEARYYDYYKFYIPKGNQVNFQFYKFKKI